MIHIIAHVSALPGHEAELKNVLLRLIEPTLAEPGCVSYQLLQGQANPTEFVFWEEWKTIEDANAHLQSPHLELAYQDAQGLVAKAPEIFHYLRVV